VARIDDLLLAALKMLPPKPDDKASARTKGRYSELVSRVVAQAFAEELRHRGLRGARPAPPGVAGKSGAERRMAGGIGAKKVDVTWATEESGLIFAVSIKSINFRDRKSGNFQKNLTNRRGDMLFEGVTLHRRFPFAILAGFFFLDKDAAHDGTGKRHSTFLNAHKRLKLFTGRNDPAGRDDQFERLYLVLLDANPFQPQCQAFNVGTPESAVALDEVFSELVAQIAERNPDFYQAEGGRLVRAD
jgi:hypothetical protein